jgi:hypothetical protein
MLNSASETLVKHVKKENKKRVNSNKITVYTFKKLTTCILKQNFYISMLILIFDNIINYQFPSTYIVIRYIFMKCG